MNKYAKFFTSNDFLITRRDVLHLLKDIETTMFLTYLADKYKYFYTNNMITIYNGKEYFFNIHNDIENSLYLTSHQQRKCTKILKELGILETVLKGIPAKTFYHINFEILIDLLSNEVPTTAQNDLQQDVKNFNNNNLNNLTHITNNKELITNTNNKEEELQKSKDFCPPPDKLTSKGVYEKYIKQGKINYRGNLFFKQNELETLKSKWNADKLDNYFDRLDNWLNTPKNWKLGRSHYLTVNDWIYEAYKKALLTGYQYQVDLEWKANNNEKDYTDIDMSKQMLVEDF